MGKGSFERTISDQRRSASSLARSNPQYNDEHDDSDGHETGKTTILLRAFVTISFGPQLTTTTIGTIVVPQRTVSKANSRKKSLRQIVKPTVEHHVSKTHHEEEEAEDDTFEFTHIENVKHFNGLPRVRQVRRFVRIIRIDLLGRHFNSQNGQNKPKSHSRRYRPQ